MIYKILEALRIAFHWITEKRNYYTFLVAISIVVIGAFLVAQFWLGLDPFSKFIQSCKDLFEQIKSYIIK